ncbi:hypothetical protein JXL83_01825 [candidate division WOR-3 bacterium]|nr:hypothetical protein [candidate division WOR-3 bacterium]
MKETDLHSPLKRFLESQGYSVNCEVNNCDIVARKDGEIVVVEMKTRLSVALLAQANLRKEITDSVYVAVPVSSEKKWTRNYRSVRKLLRTLEIGLIAVYFMKKKTRVEILLQPLPFAKRKSKKKLRAVLNEIHGRYAELNVSGSSGSAEKITSYRLEAIKIASALEKCGESSPKKLREMGCFEKTQRVLHNNFYGWFDRKSKGLYILNDSGKKALRRYETLISLRNEN